MGPGTPHRAGERDGSVAPFRGHFADDERSERYPTSLRKPRLVGVALQGTVVDGQDGVASILLTDPAGSRLGQRLAFLRNSELTASALGYHGAPLISGPWELVGRSTSGPLLVANSGGNCDLKSSPLIPSRPQKARRRGRRTIPERRPREENTVRGGAMVMPSRLKSSARCRRAAIRLTSLCWSGVTRVTP